VKELGVRDWEPEGTGDWEKDLTQSPIINESKLKVNLTTFIILSSVL
jgi:hypothetical protein